MGLDAIAISRVYQIVKNSDRMSKGLDAAEKVIIDKGLELIEESGIDPNTLPIDVRAVLRGESPNVDASVLLTPEVICAQPQMTVQQKEKVTRLVNNGQEKVQNLIQLTESVSDTVLKLQAPVNRLQGKIEPTEERITFASEIVQIIKLLALPTSFGMVGQPNSVNNTFASILISLSDLIEDTKMSVETVQSALGTMTSTINGVASQVNAVNVVVDPFTKLLTMMQAVTTLQDQCPLVTQGDISAIENDLANNITGNLAQAAFLSNPFADSLVALEESLAPNAPNPVFYKNFQLILEYEPEQRFTFPSRRIKGVRTNSVGVNDGIPGYGSEIVVYNNNPQVNPSLEEGAYSYAKNVRVLLNEAKFAIDVYTANITLWEAPPLRDRVVATGSNVNYDLLTPEQQEQYREFYGEPQVNPITGLPRPLPRYIIYGGTNVNLNNSPTDIEYGANALINGSPYSSGEGLAVTSYIQSGTIQVNSPISIEMTTFGGTGNPNASGANEGGNLGFTEALLTIRRSTAIQDNINPFTGRRAGVDQEEIDEFIEDYGFETVNGLETLYQLANEDVSSGAFQRTRATFNNTDTAEDLTGLNYLEQLTYIRDEYFGENGTSRNNMPYRTGNAPEGIFNAIEVLFDRTKPLLFNRDILTLSRRLKGSDNFSLSNASQPGDQSNRWILLYSRSSTKLNNKNYYEMARRNSVDEDREFGTGAITRKAVTLVMMRSWLQYVVDLYEGLFGGNGPNYNNGGWVSAATSLPLIPSSVSGSTEDVKVIEISQLAGRDETISENIGGLDILGTYSYTLEIIDSLPEEGGAATSYPPNFTNIRIKDFKSATNSIDFT